MRFKKLNLNLVVVLDALLAEGSVTRAGERLNVSQTTVSDALGRLREYFNDELLTQVGRRMVPTPLGESLVKPVRDMLLQADVILNTQPNFDPATATRKFTLMMTDYVSTVLMFKALPRIAAAAPHVAIEIVPHSRTPWESLDRGDVDFLIMPEQFLTPDHPQAVLFKDDFCCVVWNGNDAVRDTINERQFLELGHVVIRLGDNRTPSVEEYFVKTLGNARRVETITMDFNSAPQMVVGTMRITTIQWQLARHHASFLPIRIVQPTFNIPGIDERIQWNRFSAHDPGIAWIRDLLVQIAAEHLQDRHEPALAKRGTKKAAGKPDQA